MTARRPCPGVRQKPLAHKPGTGQSKHTSEVRYGTSQRTACRNWYVAHKDGTPVYHKEVPR